MKISSKLMVVNAVIVSTAVAMAATVASGMFHAEMARQANISQDTRLNLFWELARQKGRTFRLENGKLIIGRDYVVNGNPELPDMVKLISGGTATVFMGDTRVTTNVMTANGSRAIGTKLRGPAYDAIFKHGKPYRGEADILGIPYFTAYDPIRGPDGQIVGVLYVGVQKEVFLASFERLKLLYFAISLVLSVLSSALVMVVVRRAFKRFDGVISVLGEAAAGNLNVRAESSSNDEIGRLADSVNTMVQNTKRALQDVVVTTRKAAAAEDLNRLKSTFLANMSHELRTPLNAIIGYSEMLQEDAAGLGAEDFVPDLQKIEASGKHLLALINDILDLSKIEAGKLSLFFETCDVGRLVGDVVTTIQPLADKNGNVLQVSCPDDVGEACADVTRVRQVLFNLLSNACKFTRKGTVKLDVRREIADRRTWIRFKVSDTGIGLKTEQIERLFQAFSQADASTTKKFGGTGLGLAISRQFCKMMGGDIAVESEFGKGSTFTASILADASPDKPADQALPSALTAPQSNRETVLMIDDNASVHDLLARRLRRDGFDVASAMSGEEGLRLARQIKPMAITLDVMMPGMDGWMVLKELKADPAVRDIPVVMVTILDDKSLGFALGATDYLIKPIQHDDLLALLNRHRPRAKLEATLVAGTS